MTDDADHRFPLDVDDLSAELLTEVMARRTPGLEVETFEVVATKRCGEGIASTADRVNLRVHYRSTGDPPPATPPPERLVLKTMLANPHAPAAMYENEVRFYTELRDRLPIEAPRCLGGHVDPASGRFGLLLEDLTEREARFPDATQPVPLAAIESLLAQLARLHATHWQDPRFAGELSWIPTPTSGGMFEVFDVIGLELISDQVERNPFKAELIAPLGWTLEEMWDRLWQTQREMATEPVTLLHGDPHIGNTYLLPGARGGLLDWQLMVRGRWAHDVIYLLTTSLAIDERRRHQEHLLRGYLDELRAHGVTDVPTEAEAWELCRRAALWGLVIGWLITPPENYGPEITTANLERVVTAVADLDTLAPSGSRSSGSPGSSRIGGRAG